MIARRARTWVALAALATLVPFGTARAGDTASKKPVPRSTATSVPVVAASPRPLGSDTAPYHGSLDNITWGGHGELRFGYDVTAGVSDPSWFSVGRVNGFMEAKLGSNGVRGRGRRGGRRSDVHTVHPGVGVKGLIGVDRVREPELLANTLEQAGAHSPA